MYKKQLTSLGVQCMQYIIDADGRTRPHGTITYTDSVSGQTLRTEYWENGMYKGHQGYSSIELIDYFKHIQQSNTSTNSMNLDYAYKRLYKIVFDEK